jgi:hypothetical protein
MVSELHGIYDVPHEIKYMETMLAKISLVSCYFIKFDIITLLQASNGLV